MSSTAAAAAGDYPSANDYALLMGRFKLLNLVQRVAHRDVLDMIETVGLEALTYKGAVQRWLQGSSSIHQQETTRTSRRRSGYSTHDRDGLGRQGAGRRGEEASFPRRRASGMTDAASEMEEDGGETSAARSERRTGLFNRLARPRSRIGVKTAAGSRSRRDSRLSFSRPMDGEGGRGEEEGVTDGRRMSSLAHRHAAPDPFHLAAPPPPVFESGEEENPLMNLQPPSASATFRVDGEGEDESDGMRTAVNRYGRVDSNTATMAVVGRSTDSIVVPSAHRRGPTPKVKPQGAVDSSSKVPLGAIQHAAAVLRSRQKHVRTRSDSTTNTDIVHVQTSGNESAADPSMLRKRCDGHGVSFLSIPSHAGTIQQISSAVDLMLQDHQRILAEVMKEEDGEERGGAAPKEQATAAGRDRDALHVQLSGDEEEEDDIFILSRMNHAVDRMTKEVTVLSEHLADCAADELILMSPEKPSSQQRTTHDVGVPGVAATATSKRSGRRRGAMPEAMVHRLQSHRVNNLEYIAYNEKLWNTSRVSQFVFAQRLTNTLLDDCLDEVVHEVTTILDDYAEGLMEHELQ